jgi:hypothetical protein
MIEEVISSGYAPEGISAVRFLKNNPEMIKNMTLAWDMRQGLIDPGVYG